MKRYIIAIDGPAGAGKSTIAKAVAKRLGYTYVDSGAVYRSITYKAMKNNVDVSDEKAVIETANNTSIELKDGRVFVDGLDVSSEIRTENVSKNTKVVAAVEGVRRVVRAIQVKMGEKGGIVMEGRDIGTEVFSNAEFKFYLDASVEERAKRRYRQLVEKGGKADIEEIKRGIRERDHKDMTRKHSPLMKAEDAILVDSTSMTANEVADSIIERIKEGEEFTIKSHWLYYAGRFMFRVLYAAIWRNRVSGHGNIPETGGVIIAPNHMSYADPPLVGSSMKRPLHFMAKKELFAMPVLGFLIKRTNAFPVKRGQQDVGAFKAAFRLLQSGEALLVFPEGTRSKDGNIGKARAGIGMIAVNAGVPVVPVRVTNSGKLGQLKPLKVVFGKPLNPPKEKTRESYQKFAEKIVEEIKKLG
ncbi:MAG: (d)CMP kinase [Endomicrobiales bacterium]|nr:(d)CMP kinase [Endomicrobiales bacterium]